MSDALRLQIRLYEGVPDDDVVLAWIKTLPANQRGRRRLKEHILSILVPHIKDVNGQENSSPAPMNFVTSQSDSIDNSSSVHSMRDRKSSETIITDEQDGDELPDFPDVSTMTWD